MGYARATSGEPPLSDERILAARYAIDMLEMLAEKTKGNLTPGEERGLRDLLHQLRMAFVAVQTGDVGTVGP